MLRAMDRWLPGYLASMRQRPHWGGGPRHLLVCVADHFEPFDRTILPDGAVTGGVADDVAGELVEGWCRDYRKALDRFRDVDGRPPRHTFFYPWDEYESGCIDRLAAFCRDDYGEVEIHLHHRNDSEDGLQEKLAACRDTYATQHGLLGRRKKDEAPVYAFVHGNWCLCNARQDGDWCGVDRELSVLRGTGCYADLTFPSAPHPTQPRCINTIHYGRDPGVGERGPQVDCHVRCGGKAHPGVLMIPGPLGLNWRSRKRGVLPRLENGEISGANPASANRLSLWKRIGIHVPGRSDWIIVKLHTHGAAAANRSALLGPEMAAFHEALAEAGEKGSPWLLHYVTARELFNIIKAAEAGCSGSPSDYRDHLISPPPFRP